MASSTSICNLALTRIGHEPVLSLDEDSKAARMCTLHYSETLEFMLRAHPWNFAVRRAELAQLVSTPEFEYTYQYTMPADCLKVLRTEDDSLGYVTDYRLESTAGGERVMVTDASTVKIEYVASVTDPNLMDALFRDAFAARLAAELAVAMTDNSAMTEKLFEIAETKLRIAMTADAQEGTPRDIIADEWVMARI